jgi:hypothetical protein
MVYVIYGFSGLFILLAAAMLYVFFRGRQIGAFLMGMAYGTAGVIAIQSESGWPLLAGFVVAWMLKLMGYEPGGARSDAGDETGAGEPGKGESRQAGGGP